MLESEGPWQTMATTYGQEAVQRVREEIAVKRAAGMSITNPYNYALSILRARQTEAQSIPVPTVAPDRTEEQARDAEDKRKGVFSLLEQAARRRAEGAA